MGIHNLTKLLAEHAQNSCKENDIKNYFGRKIAIDASMSLYQFLIAVRQDGNQLTNDAGETTSHLNGLFYRTIRMIEHGIKPVYVFDGKPPQMKAEELEKRTQNREKAQKELEKAVEEGDLEAADRYNRRLVKVTKEHNDECKKLLKLMGVPYINAPCEAEAQCSAMVKAGVVYGTATEDMDALTFGSSVLLRHMTVSEAKKVPIREYHLEKLLADLEMSQAEFVDLCILLGCDYCDSIKGIGPKRAFELINTYRSIDESIKNLDLKKYPLPQDWKYKEARELFINPEITAASEVELKWTEPDEEALVDFMVNEKNFNEERIRNGIKKLTKSRTGTTQGRIDSFFKISAAPVKRKADEDKSDKKKTKSLLAPSKQKKKKA